MDNSGAIIVAIVTSAMCSLGCRSAAINGDKALRTNSKFFPKYYSIPPRWVRILFALPKRHMANFLVLQLYFSLIHIALGVINVAFASLNFPWSKLVFGYIVMCTCIWGLLDGITYMVLLHIFKARDRSKPLKQDKGRKTGDGSLSGL